RLPVIQQEYRFAFYLRLDAPELCPRTQHVVSACSFEYLSIQPDPQTVTVFSKCIPCSVERIQSLLESVVLLTRDHADDIIVVIKHPEPLHAGGSGASARSQSVTGFRHPAVEPADAAPRMRRCAAEHSGDLEAAGHSEIG